MLVLLLQCKVQVLWAFVDAVRSGREHNILSAGDVYTLWSYRGTLALGWEPGGGEEGPTDPQVRYELGLARHRVLGRWLAHSQASASTAVPLSFIGQEGATGSRDSPHRESTLQPRAT